MSEQKKWRTWWMDTDDLNSAIERCDLGDACKARVRVYPHKDMIPELTECVEIGALRELEAKFDLELAADTQLIDQLRAALTAIIEVWRAKEWKGQHKYWSNLGSAISKARAALGEGVG